MIVVVVVAVLRVGMEVHIRCVKNDRRRHILLYEVFQNSSNSSSCGGIMLRVGMEVHIWCVKNDRRHLLLYEVFQNSSNSSNGDVSVESGDGDTLQVCEK